MSRRVDLYEVAVRQPNKPRETFTVTTTGPAMAVECVRTLLEIDGDGSAARLSCRSARI